MKDILAKRIFWVILGVVVLCMLLFYVFVVWSLDQRNAATRSSIETIKTQMKTYASMKDIKNQAWIQAYQRRKIEVDNATAECEDNFKQYLSSINSRFQEEGSPILDSSRWKDKYTSERRKMEENLKAAGVHVTREAFDLTDFGDKTPTKEEIDGQRTPNNILQPGAQKEFWLEYYVVESILKVTPVGGEPVKPKAEGKSKAPVARSQVARLVKIAIQRPSAAATTAGMEGAPEAVAAEVAQYQLVDDASPTYLIIPFILTVDVDWQYAPLLIRNLETSTWPFYVLTVDATRLARAEAEREAVGAGINPSSLVRMTIHAEALDFTPLKEKIPAITAPAPPKLGK